MAIALSTVERRPDLGRVVTDVTLDGSYAAGGYSLTPAQLGMISVTHVNCEYRNHATATASNVAVYDTATQKLKVFETGAALSGALAECVAGDITSAHIVRVSAEGTPIV